MITDIPIEVLFHTKKTHGMTDEILSQIDDNSFIIIPDASANTLEMAKKLDDKNVQCLVLDHHELRVDYPNIITVNNQYGNVQNNALSGAGVTHKFCQYVDKINDTHYAEQMYDLVALSIVSDSCDVTTLENRAYIYYTFELNKLHNPFLIYLCDTLIKSNITPHELSFKIVNVLNAVCRSDNQELKNKLFKCFVGESNNFDEVLLECKAQKKKQDEIVSDILDNTDVINSENLVIMITDEPYSVSGLVANKLQTKYLKPSFVLHKDGEELIGSVRSPVSIKDKAEESKLFTFNQGHSMAYGTSFPVDNIDNIIKYFKNLDLKNSQCYNVINSYQNYLIPNNLFSTFEGYDILWAQGLPMPMIHYKFYCTGTDWMSLRGATIKIVHDDVTFIKFFVSNKQKEQWHIGEDVSLQIDIIGSCGINVYNNCKSKQVVIEAMEVSKIE